MFIELVMPSNHLILCRPLLLLPSIFPSIRSFPMSQLLASGGQSTGVSASASVFPMNIQGWFPLGWTGLILLPWGQGRGFHVHLPPDCSPTSGLGGWPWNPRPAATLVPVLLVISFSPLTLPCSLPAAPKGRHSHAWCFWETYSVAFALCLFFPLKKDIIV